MKPRLFCILIFFISGVIPSAACNSSDILADSLYDGPYIFNSRHKLRAISIKDGQLIEEYITPDNASELISRYNLTCSFEDLSADYLKKPIYSQIFEKVDSIGIISDIHGEFNTYITLLKASGIIDNNLRWKFGKGHLVVLGDIFDRGNKVTEVLWHLFCLEKQAAEAGGMVHVLLGNHEIMELANNTGFLNDKYRGVEKLTGTRYYNLYGRNTVLGSWLRSKPVVITIDDIILVHAGISPELFRKGYTVEQINRVFSEKIVGRVLKEQDRSNEQLIPGQNKSPEWDNSNSTASDFSQKVPENTSGNKATNENEIEELMFLVQNKGPVWYGGYFSNEDFSETHLTSILDFYGKKHIVVGHSTYQHINTLYNKKIIGVDAGIWIDKIGEMLLYKAGSFYSVNMTGKRIKL